MIRKQVFRMLENIQQDLKNAITLTKEKASLFFKTGKGEYAEHDQFIGVSVPNLRKISKEYALLHIKHLQKLIQSKVNEERLLALFILVNQYQKTSLAPVKNKIYEFYLENLKHVNNWNLVDASAPFIVGIHLYKNSKSEMEKENFLFELANSKNLWYRRVAIVSTLYFIRQNDLALTFKIAHVLLDDEEDLIHKATGWMLREAGKKNKQTLVDFLSQHSIKMPRTMLRYAIEKFSLQERKDFLKKSINN